ncbi:OLC1v1013083C1 [Oldenlandia corymbosa var. corymbosa]|uniref:OLC1v1013083C1 n=1 Tax=Oldenlandia corymbosa var. corymbosa TaxID=529605 RepID=A0AAV1E0M4_OLDCO|nr:OLC1v1013083C1 [Oldenlandia corymbosa var. corymbosa]
MAGVDELCILQPHQSSTTIVTSNGMKIRSSIITQVHLFAPFTAMIISVVFIIIHMNVGTTAAEMANRVEMSVDVEIPGLDFFINKKQGLCNDNLREDCEDLAERIGTASEECLNGAEEDGICGLEEGERIIDDHPCSCASSQKITDEGVSWEEENWLAQYGQVSEATEISDLDAQIADLWDWEIMQENGKDGKSTVVRLAGRLVKSLSRLHPSVSSGRV